MAGQARGRDELDGEIMNAISELIGTVIGRGEQLAQKLSIPVSFIKALHTMECPMAMKDLGKRMHCDPSFVTLVADALEKHGLARREPHPGDRRIKNLVLTSDGESLRQRVEREIAARMPWSRALNDEERKLFLALIRKMLNADQSAAANGTGTAGAEAGDPDSPSPLVTASRHGQPEADGTLQAVEQAERELGWTPRVTPAGTGEVSSSATAGPATK
jgi:MarR family transcriptional regulator, organic hydroperoxide resistance regulator